MRSFRIADDALALALATARIGPATICAGWAGEENGGEPPICFSKMKATIGFDAPVLTTTETAMEIEGDVDQDEGEDSAFLSFNEAFFGGVNASMAPVFVIENDVDDDENKDDCIEFAIAAVTVSFTAALGALISFS